MDGEIRPTPGERLVSRMMARTRRRPRMGFSPEFYGRLGLDDPWAFEESAGAEEPAGDGMVFLSAQPYYAMLRRLAAARRRRERRLASFTKRRAGSTLRAVARAWPGEGAQTLA